MSLVFRFLGWVWHLDLCFLQWVFFYCRWFGFFSEGRLLQCGRSACNSSRAAACPLPPPSFVVKKRSVIWFSPPFSLSSFSFLALALAVKHHRLKSTKLRSSRDDWYPISDAIVVMCKVSTSQWLIKRYLTNVPPDGRVWHKAIFRWVQAQGRGPDASCSSKNASGPVGVTLKRGTSGTRQ